MNIGIIGSGGREHALCQKMSESKYVRKIFSIPGNAGTSNLSVNLKIDFLNFKKKIKLKYLVQINMLQN